MCNTIVHRYNNLTMAAEVQHQNIPVQLPLLAPTVYPCNLLAQGDSIKTWGIVLKWRCRTSYTKLPEVLLPLLDLQTYCSLLHSKPLLQFLPHLTMANACCCQHTHVGSPQELESHCGEGNCSKDNTLKEVVRKLWGDWWKEFLRLCVGWVFMHVRTSASTVIIRNHISIAK